MSYYLNNAQSITTSNITSYGLSIPVQDVSPFYRHTSPGSGTTFTTQATLQYGSSFEIITINSSSTSTPGPGSISVVARGQEGTTAQAFLAGSRLEARITAQTLEALAPLSSPSFSGTPTTPTPSFSDISTTVANTNFVHERESYIFSTIGTELAAYAPLSSPVFTGVTGPQYNNGSTTSPLVTLGELNTTLGSYATLASPSFTGLPTTPTAPIGTDTSQIASTAFVNSAVSTGLATGTVTSINGVTGGVSISGSSGIGISTVGSSIAISYTGSGGGSVTSINGESGTLSITAGSGISITTPTSTSIQIAASGIYVPLISVRNITSGSGSYIPASYVKSFLVMVIGATGGSDQAAAGGCGGAGYSEKYYANGTFTPGTTSYSYSIGAGGVYSGFGFGYTGGTTTFGPISISSSGGSYYGNTAGSAGGIASGGTINFQGGHGGIGYGSGGWDGSSGLFPSVGGGGGGAASRTGVGGAGGNYSGFTPGAGAGGGTGGNAASGTTPGAGGTTINGSAYTLPSSLDTWAYFSSGSRYNGAPSAEYFSLNIGGTLGFTFGGGLGGSTTDYSFSGISYSPIGQAGTSGAIQIWEFLS